MGPDRGQNGSVLGWETGRRQRRPQERGQRSQSVGSATSCGSSGPAGPAPRRRRRQRAAPAVRGAQGQSHLAEPRQLGQGVEGAGRGDLSFRDEPPLYGRGRRHSAKLPARRRPLRLRGNPRVSAPALAGGGGWGGVGAWSGFSADTGWPRGPGRLAAGRCSLPLGVQSGGPSSRQGVTLMGNPGGRWRGGLACAGTKLTSP